MQTAPWRIPGWNEIEAVSLIGVPALEPGVLPRTQKEIIYVPDPDFSGEGACSDVMAAKAVASFLYYL